MSKFLSGALLGLVAWIPPQERQVTSVEVQQEMLRELRQIRLNTDPGPRTCDLCPVSPPSLEFWDEPDGR